MFLLKINFLEKFYSPIGLVNAPAAFPGQSVLMAG
jgi:hypothetical protein